LTKTNGATLSTKAKPRNSALVGIEAQSSPYVGGRFWYRRARVERADEVDLTFAGYQGELPVPLLA
jgi:hypothetical protein